MWTAAGGNGLEAAGAISKKQADEPVLLVFDIFDKDDGEDAASSGDHLGSTIVNVHDFDPARVHSKDRMKKCVLQAASQRIETMLDENGRPKSDGKFRMTLAG